MRADLLAGTILLVVSGVFWFQREPMTTSSSIFPDFVLVVLALSGLAIIALGVLRADRSREPRQVDLRMLAVAAGLVLAWALAMGLIGFTITGTVGFVIMALLVREGRPTTRTVVTDLVVGGVVVVGCFLIFTRVLLVPLPVSTLIGM